MGNHASPPPENATPWHVALSRRLRRRAMATAAAGAGLVLVATFAYASVAYALHAFGSRGSAHNQQFGCAAGTCGSGRAAPILPDFTLGAHSTHPSASAARHRNTSTPAPAPAARTTPEPTPRRSEASVAFSVGRQWSRGFEGEITIVNRGNVPIPSWKISLALPGDHLSSVRNADGHMEGKVLVLQASSKDQQISPGDQLTFSFVMDGPRTSPTSCTYNGAACS